MGSNALTVYRGDDKIYDITVRDIDNEVVDITGYRVKFTVRKNAKDSVALISKATSGSGIALIDQLMVWLVLPLQ